MLGLRNKSINTPPLCRLVCDGRVHRTYVPGLRLTGMPEIQPGPARPGEAEARVVQVCVLRKMHVAEIESLSYSQEAEEPEETRQYIHCQSRTRDVCPCNYILRSSREH